ncbi:MAG: hypothetical protein ACLPVF_12215 [Acidimicrobiales bacterium]
MSYSPGLAVEKFGQNRRGHDGEQCVQSCGSSSPGDAIAVEPFGELVGLDWLPGVNSRKEPVAVRMSSAGHVAGPLGECPDVDGERRWHGDQVLAYAQRERTV